jgi:negative regulator of replication initiation
MRQFGNRLSQFLSILLSTALVFTSLSLADVAHAAAPTSQISQFSKQLAIPTDLGFITDAYAGKDSKTVQVILLQDLHLHYPTQQRILKILNHLYDKNRAAGVVAVEGLQGDYDTTNLASLPGGKTKQKLVDYFMRQSYRASQAMGRLIVIDVDIQPGSEQVAADTVSAASDAVVRMARSSNLRSQVERVRRVVVSDQGRPSVTLVQGTLRIVIDADVGIAGRPSSARIVRVVGGEALNR